jgi:hypothetical protein
MPRSLLYSPPLDERFKTTKDDPFVLGQWFKNVYKEVYETTIPRQDQLLHFKANFQANSPTHLSLIFHSITSSPTQMDFFGSFLFTNTASEDVVDIPVEEEGGSGKT